MRPTTRCVLLVAATTALVAASTTAYAVSPGPWDVTRFATPGSVGKCPLEACHPVEWAVCRGRIGGEVPTRGLPPRRVGGLPREDRWGSAHSTWRPTPWGLASGGDGGGRDVGKLVA